MVRRGLPLVVLGAVVAVIAHLPALAGGYVLDDASLLVNNPFVRDLDGLIQLLRSEFFAASGDARNAPYYRPLSGALYWLSYQLFGTKPLLQHALNLGLHATVVATLLLVIVRVTKRRRAWATLLSVCAALAAHPTSPEIVAYVGGRQELLGWNIVLFGFWLVVHFELVGIRLAAAVLVCCSAAAFTREYFLAAPLLFLPLAALGSTPRKQRAATILASGALSWIVVFGVRRGVGVGGFDPGLLDMARVIEAAAAIALRTLQVVFWPVDVSVEVTPMRLGTWSAAALLSALALVTGWSLKCVWKSDRLLFLLGFAWACLWSTIALHVPVAIEFHVLSDRYAYAVLVGMSALLSAAFQALPPLGSRGRRPLELTGGALVVLAMIPLCWARASEWHNERSLQAAMYARRPADPHSQLAEGLRRFAEREYDAAYDHCLAFSQAVPNSDRAGLCLGSILFMRGKPEEAAKHLELYAFARPSSLRARVTLFRSWFAADDLNAVERGLDYYTPMLSNAPDLEAARSELERRRAR